MRVAPRAPGAVFESESQRRINKNRGNAQAQQVYAPDDLVRPHTCTPSEARLISTVSTPDKETFPVMRLKGVVAESEWRYVAVWPFVDAADEMFVTAVLFSVEDSGGSTRIKEMSRGTIHVDGATALANGRLPWLIELSAPQKLSPLRRYALGFHFFNPPGLGTCDVRGVGDGVPVAYVDVSAGAAVNPDEPITLGWTSAAITASHDEHKSATTGGFVASGQITDARLDKQATLGSMSPLAVLCNSMSDLWY